MADDPNTTRCYAKAAAEARTNLTIFYAVIAMLEGGTITTSAERDAQRVIAICRSASAKQLRLMDRALAECC